MEGRFAGVPVKGLRGQRRDRFIANPAAGKDWSLLLPSGEWYRLLLLYGRLTTSAQAATRIPQLEVVDGDNLTRALVAPTSGIAASKHLDITAAPGVGFSVSATGESATIEVPELLIPGGWKVEVTTAALQTEDQWSRVRLLFEELNDDYPATPAGIGHPDLAAELMEVLSRAA